MGVRVPESRGSTDPDAISRRLDFLAALMCLSPDATEADRLRIAKRLGFSAREVARIFGKSEAAAIKALQRLGRDTS